MIMKKVIFTIVALISFALSADAMTYEQARTEALFLTDKMAYELNLTGEQYEAAYEINLDYLMGVTNRDDVYGVYWERRNLDMSYILLDWQWRAFRAASYFFRPLYWNAGYWHFGIYARYPRRHYLYFGRPAFYSSYRGGHSWRMNGERSYYHGRRDHFVHTGSRNHGGMRDRWDKGDFRHNSRRESGSSTHVTVNHRDGSGGHFGQRRGQDSNPSNNRHSIGNGENRSNSGTGIRNNENTSRVNNRGTFSGSRSEGRTIKMNTNGRTDRPSANLNTMRTNRSSSSVSSSRSTSSRRTSSHSAGSRSSSSRSGGGRFGGQR